MNYLFPWHMVRGGRGENLMQFVCVGLNASALFAYVAVACLAVKVVF